MPLTRVGLPRCGIPRLRVLDPFRPQAHQHFGAQVWPPITVSALRGHQLMIATDNTTVVAYINKQGGTHSHTLVYQAVDLFLWLQTQDIAIMFMFPPFPLLSKVIQKLRTTQECEVMLIAPWWPSHQGVHIYYVFVWTTLSSFRTAGTYCHNRDMSRIASRMHAWGSHATVPNSRIFEEVSRLVAAPRRPSTYRVYNDRWLCFAHWTAGQGIVPLGQTAAQIATFLYYLFDNQGLSP